MTAQRGACIPVLNIQPSNPISNLLLTAIIPLRVGGWVGLFLVAGTYARLTTVNWTIAVSTWPCMGDGCLPTAVYNFKLASEQSQKH